MSIRLRLTLWYVLVLGVALAAFSLAVYFDLHHSTDSAFNQALKIRAEGLSRYVSFKPRLYLNPEATDEATGDLGTTSLWMRVVNTSGIQIPGGSQGRPFAGTPRDLLHDVRPGFHQSGTLRLYVLPLISGNRTVGAIQAVTSTKQLEVGNQQVVQSLLIAGVFIVALAAIGGFFIAQVALRPVDRITSVAREIGSGDLSRRVSGARGKGIFGSWSRGDELDRLVTTFDQMLTRLEDADVRRRMLTTDAAHELATPVTAIRSEAEVSLLNQRSIEEYRDALRKVVSEAGHLERIVDDLFTLASAESGSVAMRQELVELDEVCRDAVRSLSPVTESRSQRLSFEGPPSAVVVVGDEGRLGQVVRNIVENASKNTPEGGAITVALRVSTSDPIGPSAEVTVVDTGPGVLLEDATLVFDRFHRRLRQFDGEVAGERKGSGLGLAICKAIVEAHGGHIRVANPGERGATFVFDLPLAEVPAATAELE